MPSQPTDASPSAKPGSTPSANAGSTSPTNSGPAPSGPGVTITRAAPSRIPGQRRKPSKPSKPRKPAPKRVGDILVDDFGLDPAVLAEALDTQARTGSPLGQILLATGQVSRLQMFQALAAAWKLPFIDVASEEVDATLLEGLDVEVLAREGWLPMRREGKGAVRVATCVAPSPKLTARVGELLGSRVLFSATTPWDLQLGLRRHAGVALAAAATENLWRTDPQRSARTTFLAWQRTTAMLVVLTVLIFGVIVPRLTAGIVLTLLTAAFFLAVMFKGVVCAAGAFSRRRRRGDDGTARSAHNAKVAELAARLTDDELPRYTVLVPVYREANVIPDLLSNLSALNYPADKLEILVLLEADDDETFAAAKAAAPPANVTLVIVPDGLPKTKPKACNVGLFFATGNHLVIYDAEDKPDPDQLRQAVAAFKLGGDELVCVQAALNYWNARENALTRMFTLEYTFWFDDMLPGLDRLRLPIPLGGTSNHFRTDALRRLGGWDPFNVTEDADLGIRAAALGYRVAVIESTTYEEANRAVGNWIRQRSRWIKGYMQTALVHSRHPVRLVREVGVKSFVAFALLIGGTPLTFLVAPLLWLLFLMTYIPKLAELFGGHLWGLETAVLPPWAQAVGWFNLIGGNLMMIGINAMSAYRRGGRLMMVWALAAPVYWVLHSIAAYKALWQLVFKPHYWEKTVHGLSTMADVELHAAAEDPAIV